METNIAKTYDPKEFEDRIYETWEKNGYFKAEPDETKEPYTIVMPPPNITGQLHMGHALDQTLQDVLIRWKRMQGYNALWIPGTDHASIATEVKVVEKIRADEGLEKEDLGREEFLKRAWEWKNTYGNRITEQVRRLGNSCDWERERFTMDEGCNVAVTEFFIKLHERGLIYRGNRLINWCPTCLTSLSDAEVDHEDKSGNYYNVRYHLADNLEESIVIATTRPETMFGDTAIAVHPDDERYKAFVGRKVKLPFTNREIEVITDLYPDMEKGTGAVKITPAHDPNDFEVGARHDLEKITCMNDDATMNKEAGKYEGMDRYECRKQLVKDLDEAGLLVEVQETQHNVGGCYRCNTVVEPMLSDQWFVKMEELAEPAIKAAKDGTVKHVPDRFEKTYLNWLENIRDWCISRQLWWGHRIPAYYCNDCNEITVSSTAPEKCTKCGCKELKQDEDVLDTWFSSALWPFSTLGWPEKTKDFDYFYPTDVLVTGYDIIFFWVVRMVFSAIDMTGEAPFDYVYVHGLVRDEQGRKMSKSLGNGIDPLEMIDLYGADALRFMLLSGNTPGNDIRFKQDKIESSRNFANKLWNASRFVLMNIEGDLISKEEAYANLRAEDKWIISRMNAVTKDVTSNMDKFELGMAAHKAYDFIWNEYCDWYIELVKARLYSDDKEDKDVAIFVLIKVLKDMISLLHPFMPYITEEIWSHLPNTEEMLIKSNWPEFNESDVFTDEEEKMDMVMEIIKSIRNIRAEADTPISKKLNAVIIADGKALEQLKSGERFIKNIANIIELSFEENKNNVPEDAMSAVINGVEIFIPLDELVDFKAEFERLEKEKEKFQKELDRVNGKLANEKFMAKAPEKVVIEEKEKLEKYQDMMNKVIERIVIVSKRMDS